MKIKIRKEILLQMIKELYCDKLFPSPTLTNINGVLISIDSKKELTRWFKLSQNKYTIIEKGKNFTFKIDAEKLKEFISRVIKTKSYITLEFAKKHSKEEDENTQKYMDMTIEYLVITLEDESFTKQLIMNKREKGKPESIQPLPFEMKNGLPQITTKYGTVDLDTRIIMSKRSAKAIGDYSKQHGGGQIKFIMPRDTRKLIVKCGDVTGIEDMSTLFPRVQVYNMEEDVEITFDYSLGKVLRSFDDDVEIFVKSNFPMIIKKFGSDYGFMFDPKTEISFKPKERKEKISKENDIANPQSLGNFFK